MSDDRIAYCPWCGGDAQRGIKEIHGNTADAAECEDCGTIFRASVPYPETEIKWSNAR